MSSPQYRKAVAKLDALERSKKLTSSGRRWLIQTIDPFHDTDQAPAGMPDTYMARNLVQQIKKKITISKDSALPAGTWDCNISSLPWVNSQSITSYNVIHNYLTGGSGAGLSISGEIGGIVAVQAATGESTVIGSAGTARDCVLVDPDFLDGPCRVVSCGFEVTNTTADLYKQGDCTVYRVPEPQRQRATYTISTAATAPWGPSGPSMSVEVRSRHPQTVGEAQFMVGSRTWAAAEGAYVPLTMAGLDNPVRGKDVASVLMRGTPVDADVEQMWLTSKINGTISATIPTTRACTTTPFNLGGAYFTGLSEQTTLTITVMWYIERFPTTLQRQLAVLAEPPPLYDPVALELYSLMMRDMPVGVMVKENGLGDWFAEVVGSVAPFAEGILSAIPHPYAQGAAQVARMAGKVADKYRVPPGEKGDGVKAALKKQRKASKKAGKKSAKRLTGRA